MGKSLVSHTVPGTLCGFLFQVERAVCALLDSEWGTGSKVGIETLDDVSVVDRDGCLVLLEQDKFTSSSSNNLTDGSFELWNTLMIWANAIADGDVDTDRVNLRLVTTSQVDKGLARVLSEANTEPQIGEAVLALREAGSRVPVTIFPIVERVLAHSNDTLRSLVGRVTLYDRRHRGVLSGISEVVSRNPLLVDVAAQDVREIANSLWGWVAERVMETRRAGRPLWIEWELLSREFQNQVDLRRGRRTLEAASRVVISESDRAAHRQRTFVEQLRAVDCPPEDILEAIDDHIRCTIDRVRWAKKAELPREVLEDFDDNLKKHFNGVRLEFRPRFRGADEQALKDIGLQIYGRTMQHKEVLWGLPTQQAYTTRGRYQWLADLVEVGWHPYYRERFTADTSTKGGAKP